MTVKELRFKLAAMPEDTPVFAVFEASVCTDITGVSTDDDKSAVYLETDS